ncbi:MAG: nickel pincer cofactor biosynthesis protein LarC [Planctomycetota bacterium]|nr:MAG: nickel pincer cofactor biosynthesis protein LarC [Planctomycetota bacterium]
MSVLYVEPFGGMAGDMFLAACLDLGDSRFDLAQLRAFCREFLGAAVSLETRTVQRGALRATHLSVATIESAAARAPVGAVGAPQQDPGLVPVELAFHVLEAQGGAIERGLADLLELAARAPLSARGHERAARVLRRIAEAEARVHGLDPERVHFHELGALDTLVDVCGAVYALESLGVERVYASAPLVGSGTIRCAHGEVPVPAPGTAELLKGVPWTAGASGERTTPTGAALLAALVDSFEPPAGFSSERIGYGAGTRDPKDGPANALRVQLGRAVGASGVAGADPATREAWLLECNLDDASGEEVGFLLGELRAAGALEAWTQALSMKKDRPGVLVAALCRAEQRAALEQPFWAHTPSLGVRWTRVERTELAREEIVVELRGAKVRVKVRRAPGRTPTALDLSPEHDDLAALARATGVALRDLEREAIGLALGRFR